MDRPRHRWAVALRGTRAETEATAQSLVAALSDEDVLRVGRGHATPAEVGRMLGSSLDAVILDLHDGFDPEVLARVQGFIRGGGALILRVPTDLRAVPRKTLAVSPYGPDDVGRRMASRLEDALARLVPRPSEEQGSWEPPRGTADQAAVVDALITAWGAGEPTRTAILADRGRGKSAALGLALAGVPGRRVVVCATTQGGLAEIAAFAGRPVVAVEPSDLAFGSRRPEIVVIDEAARLPVPLLRRIHARHTGAHQVWATTTGGYEGTGRGFLLRFLADLEARETVRRLTLTTPIRWDPGDPVEAWVRDVLLLDADIVDPPTDTGDLDVDVLDRDALANDPRRLQEVFGLLVHAHYRTTPGDLERLLDAPNLAVHAALADDRVVGVCLVAGEGGLPASVCEDVRAGRKRIRGHALPETLVSHSGRAEAGALTMIRSVRIATHPGLRLRGIARALVEHVHETYQPDLFGTLFGATPELLRFRRALGYQLVRAGVSRGDRTGEHAAVMVRPVSDAARALVDGLQDDLARDLPVQLTLRADEGDLPPDPELFVELLAGLPRPGPLTPARMREAVEAYVDGPRPFDVAVVAITAFVRAHPHTLAEVEPLERALITGRVLGRRAWTDLARATGLGTVPAVMRALRRALKAFVLAADRG